MSQSVKQNLARLLREARNAIRTLGVRGFLIRLNQEIDLKHPLSFLSKRWQSSKAYANWQILNEPGSKELRDFKQAQVSLLIRPQISILLPTFNSPKAYLREAIESVRSQVYDNWQLCIADDNSSDKNTHDIIREYARKDSRITAVFRSKNGHISAASNSALEIASGEFIVPLDHDDTLSPDALYQLVVELNAYPETDLIYSDEDHLDESGKRINPYFKPDWSPDTLLSRMYTGHVSMYRRTLLESVGAFRAGFEGAQDHDLALRFTEKTTHIRHIPKILYHWRAHPASTAAGHGAKQYANDAGCKAVQEAMERRHEPGRATCIPLHPGRYETRYDLTENSLITILIPTRDQAELLDQCLSSIFEKSSYRNFEIIQLDNASKKQATHDVFKKWASQESERYRVLRYEKPFNFSAINNFGAVHANGDYLLFLNDDTEVISEAWLEGLLEQTQRVKVGAVGGKLLYPDGTIQHAGIVLGLGEQETAGHSHKNHPGTTAGYFGNVNSITNFSAVTAACLMCKRSDFNSAEGFDEKLAVAFNDVDLCLKLRQQGLNNVYLPHVELIHHESKSRGYEVSPDKMFRFKNEGMYLRNKWGELLVNDPFYSPNLDRRNTDFLIRP